MAEKINYNLDTAELPPLDPEIADGEKDSTAKLIASGIRTKTHGRHTRELMARLAEYTGVKMLKAEKATKHAHELADSLEDRYNQHISALTEDAELIDARGEHPLLKNRLEGMDKLINKTQDYVLLSHFGNDQSAVESCLVHANTYKLGIVWDRIVSLTSPIVVGKDIPWIRGVHPTKSGINPTGTFSGPVMTVKSYYTAPTKISNLSFNAYHMTGTVQVALVVDYGAWGGSVIVEDVSFYYFKGTAVKLIDAYRSHFERVLFQGSVLQEKVRSALDWSSWIDNFNGLGVEVKGMNSFSNANTFESCVFLKLRIGILTDKCKMNVLKNCTFDQINLLANIINGGNLTIDNAWGEYIERGFINSKIDSNLAPLSNTEGFTSPSNITVKNFNGLYAVPGGEILRDGQMVQIPGYPLNETVNPTLSKYFTWTSGLNPISLSVHNVTIDKTDYDGTMMVEPINQHLIYVKGKFRANKYSGGRFLNELEFRSDGVVYAPVYRASNNTLAGNIRTSPYTAQNRSQVVLDFSPENGETYNFSLVVPKAEV